MRIVPEHQDIRTFKELAHYEAHPEREESPEFLAVKRKFRKEGRKCFIDNGYCQGNLEVHHAIIELSAASGIDWERVKKDHPDITTVDDEDQMMVLCSKHHRGKYTGVHNVTYPIWIMQRYMNSDSLADFENAILREKENDKHDGKS